MYLCKKSFEIGITNSGIDGDHTLSLIYNTKSCYYKKIEILYQNYENWKIQSGSASINYKNIENGFILEKDGQSIFVSNGIDFSKIVIEEGIIKTPFLFISNKEQIKIIFEYEEEYNLYLNQLVLEESGHKFFKQNGKDLKRGDIFIREEDKFSYYGVYCGIKNEENNNDKQQHVFYYSSTQPFKAMSRLNTIHYVDDISKLKKISIIGNRPEYVEEYKNHIEKGVTHAE